MAPEKIGPRKGPREGFVRPQTPPPVPASTRRYFPLASLSADQFTIPVIRDGHFDAVIFVHGGTKGTMPPVLPYNDVVIFWVVGGIKVVASLTHAQFEVMLKSVGVSVIDEMELDQIGPWLGDNDLLLIMTIGYEEG